MRNLEGSIPASIGQEAQYSKAEPRDFSLIHPCGITDKPVTSLEREVPDPAALPALETIAHHAARQFGVVFSQPILAVQTVEALRRPPAQDTPLQVPAELQRLHNLPEKPRNA